MENHQLKAEQTHKKLERTVLAILTLYTMAMFATGLLLKWNIYIKELIFVPTAAGWLASLRGYWDHRRRAQFIAVMVWINFVVYALNTDSFSSSLITMSGVIVLLSIFSIEQVIYPSMILPILIFIYQALIKETLEIAGIHDILRLSIQLFSLYTVSAVILLVIKNRREANERLLENIRELEIAERSKDDFLVNVSHEIRTPINAVCGMSEAILQEELPLDVRRDIIDIQTAGRNLLSTVSNILDFSELESGKLELAEESYNITSTITDIINMALTLDNGRHLELIVDCDANLPSNLVGDEQKLRRIIMNLIGNAVKFTREGGVILRIQGRKEDYGINLIVSVKDSGIGIERADLEKIFTSFSQVNSKRNREEGGVGLGLAITQALVRSMGGFITVESTPGIGSEFRFTIPQRVLDETPIVSIKHKKDLFAACYINMEKYNYSAVREGYESCIHHIASQFGVPFRVCRNLPELKRRMERESYSHVFVGWEEYNEDRSFFETLAANCNVVLLLDYDQEIPMRGNMLRIYKPFTVLSIAAVFNGQKLIQNEEQHISLHNKFIAPKANVLVVDDNAMNLKVMARLLLPYQIKVSMAGGGQEALQKLDAPNFDCVFLDHMMPEMDGVETLHKIRQKPGAYYQSLPVIAFTANAIGGAREMFLSEGFDDFIAKPIELSVLERLLRRYIPTQKQIIIEEEEPVPSGGALPQDGNTAAPAQAGTSSAQSGNPMVSAQAGKSQALPQSGNLAAVQTGTTSTPAQTGNPAAPTQSQTTASTAQTGNPMTANTAAVSDHKAGDSDTRALARLSRAGIDIDQGFSYCGDKEGFREIIAIYHAEGAKRQEQLSHFFQEQDWKNYVITVHALKGNSKGIGAGELSELALQLELAGKENRIDYIQEHHEELMEKHELLLRTLSDNAFVYPNGNGQTGGSDNAPDTAQGPAPREVDEDSLRNLLDQLREKLSSFENEGLEELLQELEQDKYHDEPLTGLAKQIRQNTADFDFLSASEALEAWEAAQTDSAEKGRVDKS